MNLAKDTARKSDLYKWLVIFLWIGVIAVNIKSIFTDFDHDLEYAVAMSYRMLQGDRLFLEMWESHQTSAFLCTLLMKVYHSFIPSLEGIVIYLQACGVLLYGIVVYVTYRVIRRHTDFFTAQMIGIFLMAMRAKHLVFPEFSNMQIAFALLLFVCLVEKKTIPAAICFCLAVISYPSFLIGVIGVSYIVWKRDVRGWRALFTFWIACGIQGGLYLFYLLVQGGTAIFSGMQHMISLDESHQGFSLASMNWTSFCIGSLSFLAAVFVISGTTKWGLTRITGKKVDFCSILCGCAIGGNVLLSLLDLAASYTFCTYTIILLAGWSKRKLLDDEEKWMLKIGYIVSGISVISVILLTNLDLNSTMNYCLLGVAVALIPIMKGCVDHEENAVQHYKFGVVFCLAILLYRGIATMTLSNTTDYVWQLRGLVSTGVAKGIVSDYMGVHVLEQNEKDWKDRVPKGSTVLVVGEGSIDALLYTFRDCRVAMPSTICSPTYNEKLLEYWEIYPAQKPDVIAVECWYGDLKMEDSWILQWIENEFCATEVVDEAYTRFYKK